MSKRVMTSLLVATAIGILLLLVLCIILIVREAHAHGDAEWINELGLGCCGPSDCTQEADGRWRRMATGFYNVVTQEWVPAHMVREPSIDEHYWACRASGVLRSTSGENGSVGICLFPPAVGF